LRLLLLVGLVYSGRPPSPNKLPTAAAPPRPPFITSRRFLQEDTARASHRISAYRHGYSWKSYKPESSLSSEIGKMAWPRARQADLIAPRVRPLPTITNLHLYLPCSETHVDSFGHSMCVEGGEETKPAPRTLSIGSSTKKPLQKVDRFTTGQQRLL
jgi:hypothetical protein